mgnify:FL=1
MAKVGNLQQGYVGKLDGQCYFKGADGKTQVRAITIPKNPKTLQQRVQRVIAKTVTANYRAMKAIADHSFEGRSLGFKSMNRFREVNMRHFRERAAYLQAEGISLYSFYNFCGIGSDKFVPGAVFVSEGTLNQVYTGVSDDYQGTVNIGGNTYAQVIAALGAQRGDQVTFLTVEKNLNGKYEFKYARVILDPRNGNGAASLDSPFVAEGAINYPNSRNNGNFAALVVDGATLRWKLTGGNVVASGIIMSRRSGDKWFRSTCQLALSEDGLGSDKLSLLSAAENADSAVSLDLDSELYLNNAGTGGSEGTSAPVAPETGAQLSNSALINGASQSIAGGSVNVTTLTAVQLNGTRLDEATFKATKNGGEDMAPTSQSAQSIAWTFAQPGVAGDTYRFYKDNAVVLTIRVIEEGGGGDEPGEN